VALGHRKAVRDGIKAALLAYMNQAIVDSSALYNVPAQSVDFDGGGYAENNGAESDVEISDLLTFPGVCVYTAEAQDQNAPHAFAFAGTVSGCVEVYIRQRTGAVAKGEEDIADQLEDAVMMALNSYAWPQTEAVSVIYTRRTRSTKFRMQPLGDGFGQRILIEAEFLVAAKGTA
jgi:hypothetical protein